MIIINKNEFSIYVNNLLIKILKMYTKYNNNN